ncbi:MAG TPA: hypothetical protein VHS53_13985 [Mucilaginibacter sp.]|jgi:hypothetical protein|nr:hypothetical protein [Mucilaginibacter sp.]
MRKFDKNQTAMINPEDEVPFDDSDDLDKEDQISQQDIHATGVDPDPEELEKGKNADPDLLRQSYDATESSYTLNLGDGPKPGDKKKNNEGN